MDEQKLKLTPLGTLSELRLDGSPGTLSELRLDGSPAASPAAEPSSPVQTPIVPIADAPVVDMVVAPEDVDARKLTLRDAMSRALTGLPSGQVVQVTFGGHEPKIEEGVCEDDVDVDVSIVDPHNSPHRVKWDDTNFRPSAAMVKMQATGAYPTLEDQIASKGPLGQISARGE